MDPGGCTLRQSNLINRHGSASCTSSSLVTFYYIVHIVPLVLLSKPDLLGILVDRPIVFLCAV